MENDINERMEIYDQIATAHMLCILIFLISMILRGELFIGIYPAVNIRCFLIVALLSLGLVLMYANTENLLKNKSNFSRLIKLAYINYPLLIAILTLFTQNGSKMEVIFILPVIIAASILGKNGGLAMATVCTLIVVFYNLAIEKMFIIEALETALVIISMMYVVGWFIGVLTSCEAEQREKLKKNILALKDEIAKRQQMEKEVARLDRLHLVGEMAAGIGHEIRNPMTTVRGFLQILEGKNECKQYKEFFHIMIDELDRANSIITEYLSMAKNRPVEKKMQNINKILVSISPLLDADAIKNNISLKMELLDVQDLLLDEKEIRQIILNLVRNGIESMSNGGILTIKTFMCGNEVFLAVQDHGKGIDINILEKIGTPFFTTKDNGTGLGLAVCYSIAARHNATIEVETSLQGTTFFVKFKN